MSTYKNLGSGNFTSASNWLTCVGVENTETSYQALTTTSVAAPSYVGVGETCAGILLKPLIYVGTLTQASGSTITAELYNVTSSTIVKSVTINVTDLSPAYVGNFSSTYPNTLIYFKFDTTTTLTIGQSFAIRLKGGGTNPTLMSFWNNGSNAWNRAFVTTTTGTPTTSDTLIITGEYTGQGTNNSLTVTMDNISTTAFGNIYVCGKSTLSCESSASKNYYLKLGGNLIIGPDATYSQGTQATPIPSSSTYSLEFACTSAGQYGVSVFGSFTSYGASKTVNAKLASNVSAGGTAFTTNISTGWLSGDTIVIAGTSRTYTDAQKVTLAVNASGTTITTPSITVAHSGTSPTQADIINLTRNVKIFGNSTTNTSYVSCNYYCISTVTIFYTEFYYMGSFGIGGLNKQAIGWAAPNASLNCQYNAFHDNQPYHIRNDTSTPLAVSFVISNNVFYNTNGAAILLSAAANQTGTYTIDSNIGIYNTYLDIGYTRGTITNNTFANANSAQGNNFVEQYSTSAAGSGTFGTFSGNTFYGGGANSGGQNVSALVVIGSGGLASSLTIWGAAANGLNFFLNYGNTKYYLVGDQTLTCDNLNIFGCATTDINLASTSGGQVIIKNSTFDGKLYNTALSNGSYGVYINAGYDNLSFYNVLLKNHSGQDIYIPAILSNPINMNFINCTFSSSVEFSSQSFLRSRWLTYGISMQNYQNVNGTFKSYDIYGVLQSDTLIYNTASPSLRMTPNNATWKLRHIPNRLAVSSGESPTISVWVRKSVASDGTSYNGNQPRLMLRNNYQGGITSDTVLATATNAANGAWQQLNGTIPSVTRDCVIEVYVDCDGTLGWINVDDWSTSYYQDTRGINFSYYGTPYVELDATPKEKSFTFIN